ncbi:MAG: EF-hand domain-containing protein [Usitatibacteraceae bacterium]
MKHVNAAILTAIVTASIGVSAAFAQTPTAPPQGQRGERGHHMHERMKAADKDGDGKISRTEAAAMPRLNKHFDEIDANKDGFITKDEMKAFREKRQAQKQK